MIKRGDCLPDYRTFSGTETLPLPFIKLVYIYNSAGIAAKRFPIIL